MYRRGFTAFALALVVTACLEGRARRGFDALVQKEAARGHEPRWNTSEPDPVEGFIKQSPDGAYGVCVDAVKKNLRPATDGEHRTVDLALRCVGL